MQKEVLQDGSYRLTWRFGIIFDGSKKCAPSYPADLREDHATNSIELYNIRSTVFMWI
jgi:hypothetical protein